MTLREVSYVPVEYIEVAPYDDGSDVMYVAVDEPSPPDIDVSSVEYDGVPEDTTYIATDDSDMEDSSVSYVPVEDVQDMDTETDSYVPVENITYVPAEDVIYVPEDSIRYIDVRDVEADECPIVAAAADAENIYSAEASDALVSDQQVAANAEQDAYIDTEHDSQLVSDVDGQSAGTDYVVVEST